MIRRTSLWICILLSLSHLIRGDRFVCPGGVEYVAQTISSAQSKDFLFYGVQQGIDSAAACAKFCYETEFCRSAAYNAKAKTCDLAYANVMRCQDSGPAERVKASSYNDQITAIFCIRCPEGKISVDKNKEEPSKIDSSDHGSTKAPAGKVPFCQECTF